MPEFPISGKVDVSQLNDEMASLRLPGLKGLSVLSRRRGPGGEREWVDSEPYLFVDSDKLTEEQEREITALIAAHEPAEVVAPREYYTTEELEMLADSLSTIADVRLLMRQLAPGLGGRVPK